MQLAVLHPHTSARTAESDLLDRFVRLAQQEAAPPCMRGRVKSTHTLKSVDLDTPMLVLPLQGHKRARTADRWIDIAPGELFLVPQAEGYGHVFRHRRI